MTSLWKEIKAMRREDGLSLWENGQYYRLEDQWNWHRAIVHANWAGDL